MKTMKINPSLKTRSSASFFKAIFSLSSTHRNLWLGLAILAGSAFGNSVQAQAWLDENFNSLGAGVNLTVGGNCVAAGTAGYATGAAGGGALRILKTTTATNTVTEARWSLSDASYSTSRPSGYITFKIQQTPGVTPTASAQMNFRLGANDVNNMNSSATTWFELRFLNLPYTTAAVTGSNANLKISGNAGSGNQGNTSLDNATSAVQIRIWYNTTGSAISYAHPGTGATLQLNGNCFVVYAGNSQVSSGATGSPLGTQVTTASGVTATTVGKIGFVTGSTQSSDFIIDDIYAGASAPVSGVGITSATTATAQAGYPFSYTITSSGVTSPVYSTSTLPSGLSLNSSTGVISGTLSTTATQGLNSIELTASGTGGPATATLALTITAPPEVAPTITSAATASGFLTKAFTYQIQTSTTTPSSTPTSYAIVTGTLPAGLNLTATGAITGTPTELTPEGGTQITYNATNPFGTSDAQTLTITINPAPVFAWNNTGTDWDNASSWVGGIVPPSSTSTGSPTDLVQFGNLAGGFNTVNLATTSRGAQGVTFAEGANAYTFTATTTGRLTIGTGGMVNNSIAPQTFNLGVDVANVSPATWQSVAGGSLVFNNGINLSLTSSSRTLIIGGAGSFTVNGPIANGAVGTAAATSTGSVTVSSTGTTLFNAANTYSGLTTVSTGANLQLGNVLALGNTIGATTVSGTLDLFGFSPAAEKFTLSGGSIVNSRPLAVTIDGAVTLTGALNTINTSNAEMTMSGLISSSNSSGGFTKTGANTLNLTGVNTFTGGLTLTDGTVKIFGSAAPTRLAQVKANVTGGVVTSYTVVDGGAGYTAVPTVTIGTSAGEGIVVTATATATINNGAVTAVTVVTGGSGYTLAPKVQIYGNQSPLGTGAVTLNGGTLEATVDTDVSRMTFYPDPSNTFFRITGSDTPIYGPVTLNVAAGMTLSSYTLVSDANAANLITKNGQGTLWLRGGGQSDLTKVFAGGFSVNAGTLSVSVSANGGTGTGAITMNGGNLRLAKGVASTGIYSALAMENAISVLADTTITLDPNPLAPTDSNLASAALLQSKANKTITVAKSSTANAGAQMIFRSAELEGTTTFDVAANVQTTLQAATGLGGVTKAGSGKLTLADNTSLYAAKATATLTSDAVTSIAVTYSGDSSHLYTTAPVVTIAAPASGTTATATAILTDGLVTSLTIDNGGTGYTSAPNVNIASPAPVPNSYSGATTINAGTLALSGSLSSRLAFATTSVLETALVSSNSPTTTGAIDFVSGAKVRPVGDPTLPSYTLVTAAGGITGTPALETPIPGYSLVIEGNSLKLNVGNANTAPVITAAQAFSVAENVSLATVVGTVVATDVDANSTFSGWTIVSGNTGSAFAINAETGQITVAGALNYEGTPSYSLGVTVSDGTATSAVGTVVVTVTNIAEYSDVFGSSSPTADDNVDGISNLMAYALGATSPSSVVVPPALNTADSTKLTITALIRINDPKVSVMGEYGLKPGAWVTPLIAGVPSIPQPSGAVLGVTQWQDFSVPRGTDPTKFMHLQATQAP